MRLPRRPRNTLPRALFIWRAVITSGIATGNTHAHLYCYYDGIIKNRVIRPAPRGGQQVRRMRRRNHIVDGGEPDALDWDLDLNLELELRDDQQSRLYRYLSEGHRPRYRNESPRRAATVTLANRLVNNIADDNIIVCYTRIITYFKISYRYDNIIINTQFPIGILFSFKYRYYLYVVCV